MSYFYLGIAIVGEVAGTCFLKLSEGFSRIPYSIVTVIMYVFCFYFFSKALMNINLSVAYATWCALGIVAATLLSILMFKESLSPLGILGIIIVVVGVVILNVFGTTH